MLLENIRDFEWYNDPQNVRFVEEGMLIETKPHTDFWQNVDCSFVKDDGHFFFKQVGGDFVLSVSCSFPVVKEKAQCGLMIRSDQHNWIKAGLYSTNADVPQIGVVNSNQGASDWSIVDIPSECRKLWLKLRRRSKDFVVWYSLDGNDFKQIRLSHLPKTGDIIDIGAYACSPGNTEFESIFREIEIKTLD